MPKINPDDIHAALLKLGWFERQSEDHKMSLETKDEIEKLREDLAVLTENKASKSELRWLFGLQVSVLIIAFSWMAAQVHEIGVQTSETRETVIAIETNQANIKENIGEVKEDVDYLRGE